MRRHFLHNLFGKVILADDLWHLNRRSLAGGLALGLFVAFTPTMPFHMLLACLGAIYFRVHLPIAMAACWITNPLTVVPIYMRAWHTGRLVLNCLPYITDSMDPHIHNVSMNGLLVNSMYLWTGSLLFASVAALISWLLVQAVWHDKHDIPPAPLEEEEIAPQPTSVQQAAHNASLSKGEAAEGRRG